MRLRPSDWNKAKPPMPHQKGWIKIVDAGCKGWYDEWTGEYNCDYPWACEECPVCITSEEKREAEFIGPPNPAYFIFD